MTPWNIISATLLSIASLVQHADIEKRKQIEKIKREVSRAFHSTERYYAIRHAGQAQDNGSEFEIAAQWEAAAILIEPIDKNLADRLALKSKFWREGGTWSDDQIRDAGIQLNRVRAEGMTVFQR